MFRSLTAVIDEFSSDARLRILSSMSVKFWTKLTSSPLQIRYRRSTSQLM